MVDQQNNSENWAWGSEQLEGFLRQLGISSNADAMPLAVAIEFAMRRGNTSDAQNAARDLAERFLQNGDVPTAEAAARDGELGIERARAIDEFVRQAITTFQRMDPIYREIAARGSSSDADGAGNGDGSPGDTPREPSASGDAGGGDVAGGAGGDDGRGNKGGNGGDAPEGPPEGSKSDSDSDDSDLSREEFYDEEFEDVANDPRFDPENGGLDFSLIEEERRRIEAEIARQNQALIDELYNNPGGLLSNLGLLGRPEFYAEIQDFVNDVAGANLQDTSAALARVDALARRMAEVEAGEVEGGTDVEARFEEIQREVIQRTVATQNALEQRARAIPAEAAAAVRAEMANENEPDAGAADASAEAPAEDANPDRNTMDRVDRERSDRMGVSDIGGSDGDQSKSDKSGTGDAGSQGDDADADAGRLGIPATYRALIDAYLQARAAGESNRAQTLAQTIHQHMVAAGECPPETSIADITAEMDRMQIAETAGRPVPPLAEVGETDGSYATMAAEGMTNDELRQALGDPQPVADDGATVLTGVDETDSDDGSDPFPTARRDSFPDRGRDPFPDDSVIGTDSDNPAADDAEDFDTRSQNLREHGREQRINERYFGVRDDITISELGADEADEDDATFEPPASEATSRPFPIIDGSEGDVAGTSDAGTGPLVIPATYRALVDAYLAARAEGEGNRAQTLAETIHQHMVAAGECPPETSIADIIAEMDRMQIADTAGRSVPPLPEDSDKDEDGSTQGGGDTSQGNGGSPSAGAGAGGTDEGGTESGYDGDVSEGPDSDAGSSDDDSSVGPLIILAKYQPLLDAMTKAGGNKKQVLTIAKALTQKMIDKGDCPATTTLKDVLVAAKAARGAAKPAAPDAGPSAGTGPLAGLDGGQRQKYMAVEIGAIADHVRNSQPQDAKDRAIALSGALKAAGGKNSDIPPGKILELALKQVKKSTTPKPVGDEQPGMPEPRATGVAKEIELTLSDVNKTNWPSVSEIYFSDNGQAEELKSIATQIVKKGSEAASVKQSAKDLLGKSRKAKKGKFKNKLHIIASIVDAITKKAQGKKVMKPLKAADIPDDDEGEQQAA